MTKQTQLILFFIYVFLWFVIIALFTPAYAESPFHTDIVISSDYLSTIGYGGARRDGVHRGIDCYAENYYPVIRPIANGVVTRIGIDSIYGKFVEIQHEDERGVYYSFYAHGKMIYYSAAGEVTTDTPLMLIGETGYADNPHLHLEVYRFIDGAKVWEDPKAYFECSYSFAEDGGRLEE